MDLARERRWSLEVVDDDSSKRYCWQFHCSTSCSFFFDLSRALLAQLDNALLGWCLLVMRIKCCT